MKNKHIPFISGMREGFVRFVIIVFSLAVGIFQTACKPDKMVFNDRFRLNQVGYYPGEEKIAVLTGTEKGKFRIKAINTGKTVFEGVMSEPRKSAFSDKQTVILDFSDFTTPGEYVLEVKHLGCSYPFVIRPNVLQNLGIASLKAYYFQRSGIPIEKEYAGKWFRKGGHPDTCVYIHPSAATPVRPAGSVIASAKGWYDAGDYNKYSVNSVYTVGVLLALYEDYKDYMNDLSTHIPESENNTPDILDEIFWNIDWMLTMQDPQDGGVYHKLTASSFEGMILPEACKKQRYVVQKSVTATLGFAAVMAQASRVFASFEGDYPGIKDRCLEASRKAFEWAMKNPEAFYNQEENNRRYEPPVTTGGYEDKNASDEFFWASAELYITTRDEVYFQTMVSYIPAGFTCPTWSDVSALGIYSLIRNTPPDAACVDMARQLADKLVGYARKQAVDVEKSPFYASYGRSPRNFFWGCNSDGAANEGMAFLYAYHLTKEEAFLTEAIRDLDYILGRNAMGYCYVTGFGTKSPRFPHHRLAAGDGIDDPLPGFLVGGPNPGMQDKCTYTSSVPDEAYVDIEASYASNEIAINWNSTLSYLACGIDASVRNYPAGE